MRFRFYALLGLLLREAGPVLAQNMPAVVGQFQQTRALWHSLYNMQHLPGEFISKRLVGTPLDPWHTFLKEQGAEIIEREYVSSVGHQLPRSTNKLTLCISFLCSRMLYHDLSYFLKMALFA